mmetsp:Transcript_22359/g.32058  ORF Transcript_22359/g.32058 Transcript_22359/m.32058 type:complete len:138 (+) Transcript_22359:162-575(+)|eukprot:CAMPEP_0202458590 /NCGR_PEP_ID=MMETSP1360-20130828/26473_1 /ASSEMBLY_ACC=CAM_ASM_000848 /TAXON_ID=515479 /ORGANISM="Licmophora paradoxa, Strain CCMP2313" /LENGTH=137 /DNA_ID=CAMNT_0049079205 /DNA_START=139 /DNA_END=552 /DNA_ORIENTATION=+
MNASTFFDKMKAAGKTLVDSGARTMLKTDIAFLERQINQRKQKFGVEVYELMEQLELDSGMSTEAKENKIRLAFDGARKDIAVIQAKIECKKEEVSILEAEQMKANQPPTYDIPPSDGIVLNNGHPSSKIDSEYGLH